MLIGEVVRQSGVSRDTIRYYERMGLLQTQSRPNAANNYKAYAADTVARLELIRQGKKLGFSLTEIADGLNLFYSQQLSDLDAEDQLLEKVSTIDQKIQALQALRRRLLYVLEKVQAGQCSLQLPHVERETSHIAPPPADPPGPLVTFTPAASVALPPVPLRKAG